MARDQQKIRWKSDSRSIASSVQTELGVSADRGSSPPCICAALRSRSLGPQVDRIGYPHYLLQADKAGSLRSSRDRVRAPTLPTHVRVVYAEYSLPPISEISQGKLQSLYSVYRLEERISPNREQADHFIPNPPSSPPLNFNRPNHKP